MSFFPRKLIWKIGWFNLGRDVTAESHWNEIKLQQIYLSHAICYQWTLNCTLHPQYMVHVMRCQSAHNAWFHYQRKTNLPCPPTETFNNLWPYEALLRSNYCKLKHKYQHCGLFWYSIIMITEASEDRFTQCNMAVSIVKTSLGAAVVN